MVKKPLVSGNADDLISHYWSSAVKKEKKNPTEEFKKYCENEPWMAECKKYDV